MVNSTSDNRIPDWSNLKTSANDNIDIINNGPKIELCFWTSKKNGGENEKAGNRHFLLTQYALKSLFASVINLFPFYSSKLKDLPDDKFTFDENGKKTSKIIENTVQKGE